MQRVGRISGIAAVYTIVLALGIVPGAARAAELPRTMWSELTFVDVREGHEREYRELVRDWLAPLAQARVDARELWAWALYRVVHGDAGYDHVLIRQALDPAALETRPLIPVASMARVQQARSVLFGEARPDEPADRRPDRPRWLRTQEHLDRLAALHRVRARAVYANEDLYTDLERRGRPWLQVTWLRAGAGAAAYRQQMDTVWAPVLEAWVDAGGPAGFSGFRVVQPAVGVLGHDRVWVAQYDTFPALLVEGGLAEAFVAVHADGDPASARATLEAIAPVVGSEVWRLLETARRSSPAPMGGP